VTAIAFCFIACVHCGRAEAEELAKAQFAAKRDPNACALMYVALGKKQLLQGQ
jgi:RAVE protein 1 C terminal